MGMVMHVAYVAGQTMLEATRRMTICRQAGINGFAISTKMPDSYWESMAIWARDHNVTIWHNVEDGMNIRQGTFDRRAELFDYIHFGSQSPEDCLTIATWMEELPRRALHLPTVVLCPPDEAVVAVAEAFDVAGFGSKIAFTNTEVPPGFTKVLWNLPFRPRLSSDQDDYYERTLERIAANRLDGESPMIVHLSVDWAEWDKIALSQCDYGSLISALSAVPPIGSSRRLFPQL